MATNQSFDVTTGVDLQEVDNAVNQARKELQQRYDFKGTSCTIEFDRADGSLKLDADDAYPLEAVKGMLRETLAGRGGALNDIAQG